MNASVRPSILRSRGRNGHRSRGGMVVRAVPRGPATALLAQPGDIVVAEEEICLKFVKVSYLCAFAGNASQQGPQHSIVHVGGGRKNNAPRANSGRVEDRQSKQLALGSPRNAADDAGRYFFAGTTKALYFDDLAGEELSAHLDSRALPAARTLRRVREYMRHEWAWSKKHDRFGGGLFPERGKGQPPAR
jgi:hypothetical protein